MIQRTRGRGGRVAAYVRLPERPTEHLLAERAILHRARECGWEYVRFFRDRFDTTDQWESLRHAIQRGEILGLIMMSLASSPDEDTLSFLELILQQGVRLLTVTEAIDSWTETGRTVLLALIKE